MLLVIDVGNTHTVLGALSEEQVVAHWRVTTRNRTTDELGLLLLDLLRHQDMEPERFKGVAS